MCPVAGTRCTFCTPRLLSIPPWVRHPGATAVPATPAGVVPSALLPHGRVSFDGSSARPWHGYPTPGRAGPIPRLRPAAQRGDSRTGEPCRVRIVHGGRRGTWPTSPGCPSSPPRGSVPTPGRHARPAARTGHAEILRAALPARSGHGDGGPRRSGRAAGRGASAAAVPGAGARAGPPGGAPAAGEARGTQAPRRPALEDGQAGGQGAPPAAGPKRHPRHGPPGRGGRTADGGTRRVGTGSGPERGCDGGRMRGARRDAMTMIKPSRTETNRVWRPQPHVAADHGHSLVFAFAEDGMAALTAAEHNASVTLNFRPFPRGHRHGRGARTPPGRRRRPVQSGVPR